MIDDVIWKNLPNTNVDRIHSRKSEEKVHGKLWKQLSRFVTDRYILDFHDMGSDLLTVTFEPAGPIHVRPNTHRYGWGAQTLEGLGRSCLAVKPLKVDWYRNRDIVDALMELRSCGFFDRFPKIATYGSSMGGFAALTYSELIGADRVLAYNPQSTLDLKKVPWESRFKIAQNEEWAGPYSDAADIWFEKCKAQVVYDPWFQPDRRHVDRLRGPGVVRLHLPFVNHGVPVSLRNAGIIKQVMDAGINGTLNPKIFSPLARKRRKLEKYYEVMLSRAKLRKSPKFSEIVSYHMNMDARVASE